MTEQSIEVFLAVARTGSLCGAAQALFISQPAVSRHIKTLEEELGCVLFSRGKGQRQAELTSQGRDFVEVAQKWRQVWQEARDVAAQDRALHLHVASVGSISTYLLPGVFRAFLKADSRRALTFHSSHSREAYDRVAQGTVDLALVNEEMYHPQVETIPAYRDAMVLVSGPDSGLPSVVHPSRLDGRCELRLPWNPAYDLWHSFWFRTSVQPRAGLDEMALLEEFLSWQDSWGDSWAIVPATVAAGLKDRQGVQVHRLEEGPPDEIVYYLLGRRRKPALTGPFLDCLAQALVGQGQVELYLNLGGAAEGPSAGSPGMADSQAAPERDTAGLGVAAALTTAASHGGAAGLTTATSPNAAAGLTAATGPGAPARQASVASPAAGDFAAKGGARI